MALPTQRAITVGSHLLMWRLLRMAFWIGVVIVLLPRAPQQTAPAPSVGVVDALSAATAALSDMSQFCARQPDACAAVSQLIVQFGARDGGRCKKDLRNLE
jgi:hypothetical protein